ncbi:MAG: hypothetical protein RI549_05460, partial [Wenzhouxiangella sp.]|nr:hypothetical protein [Wenzhouxiangella sp.]
MPLQGKAIDTHSATTRYSACSRSGLLVKRITAPIGKRGREALETGHPQQPMLNQCLHGSIEAACLDKGACNAATR